MPIILVIAGHTPTLCDLGHVRRQSAGPLCVAPAELQVHWPTSGVEPVREVGVKLLCGVTLFPPAPVYFYVVTLPFGECLRVCEEDAIRICDSQNDWRDGTRLSLPLAHDSIV